MQKKKKASKLKLKTRYLLFIDTNILLNFYELFDKDYLSLLKKLEKKASIILTTCQVEMEFKNQRQRVIGDSIETYNKNGSVKKPNICFDENVKKELEAELNKYDEKLNEYIIRITDYLIDPVKNDPVFQTAEKIFRKNDALTLKVDSEEYSKVNELAKERFRIGSPPRKGKDNSIGDAINWEWILYFCQNNIDKFDAIVLVSEDKDFGIHLKKDSILNDWLHQEFMTKVPKKNIYLKKTLIEAFDLIDVKISKKERRAQEKMLLEAKANAEQSLRQMQEALLISKENILHNVYKPINIDKYFPLKEIIASQKPIEDLKKQLMEETQVYLDEFLKQCKLDI